MTSMGDAESVTERSVRRVPMMTTGVSSDSSVAPCAVGEAACWEKATDEASAVTAKAARALAGADRLLRKKIATENLQMFEPRVFGAGV
jgi:hypothetical protein